MVQGCFDPIGDLMFMCLSELLADSLVGLLGFLESLCFLWVVSGGI